MVRYLKERGELVHRIKVKKYLNILNKRFPNVKWVVHHKDNDKKNNNISNLKIMTLQEHTKIHNSGKNLSKKHRMKYSHRSGGKLGFHGVRYNSDMKRNKPWCSKIKYNYKSTYLGYFSDPISAEIVYKLTRKELYGDM